jgi:magnesium transporter
MAHRTAKVGLGPGSLIYVGAHREDQVRVRVLDYSPEHATEEEVTDLSTLRKYVDSASVTWVNVDGVHDASVISQIGEMFDVHFLLQEDIMNTMSRPKVETGRDALFVTLKSIEVRDPNEQPRQEQLSMLIGHNFLITFQEASGDPFEPIRERIRASRGIVREKNAHYLAYLILDVIIDNYIAVSARYSDAIDLLESAVMRKPSELTLHRILNLRKDILGFKRSIDPLREVVSVLQNEVEKGVSKYYRDLGDHILAEVENLAMYREMLMTLLDLYHSGISYRMNSVMKVLTIITTIFVPLTFIAGVYGMNFRHMPELGWRYGYFAVLGLMAVIVTGMVIFFQRRRWL